MDPILYFEKFYRIQDRVLHLINAQTTDFYLTAGGPRSPVDTCITAFRTISTFSSMTTIASASGQRKSSKRFKQT